MTRPLVQTLFAALAAGLVGGAQSAFAAGFCGVNPCPQVPDAVATVMPDNLTRVPVAAPGGSAAGLNGSGSVSYAPAPLVGAASTTSPQTTGGASNNIANADLVYFFTVVADAPPFAGVAVPVTISGLWWLSAAADVNLGRASAAILVGINDEAFMPDNQLLESVDTRECPPLNVQLSLCERSGSFALSGTVRTGSIRSVHLFAAAYSEYDRGSAQTLSFASATIDPVIAIDPGFANAEHYSVLLSAGIGNAALAPVPEPAGGALLALGLLLLGLHVQARSASRAACTVAAMSPAVCAALTNPAS